MISTVVCILIIQCVATILTPALLDANLNDRQVGRHVFQHTHLTNQIAEGQRNKNTQLQVHVAPPDVSKPFIFRLLC